MAENQNPKTQNQNQNQNSKTSFPQPPAKPTIEANNNGSHSGQRMHYPNPPESYNPDAATLRDQWRFAIRQYSKWYSHAWGTAILAGGAFFALGWIIKGGNPLPSRDSGLQKSEDSSANAQIHDKK